MHHNYVLGSNGVFIGTFLCQDGILLFSTMAAILPQEQWWGLQHMCIYIHTYVYLTRSCDTFAQATVNSG